MSTNNITQGEFIYGSAASEGRLTVSSSSVDTDVVSTGGGRRGIPLAMRLPFSVASRNNLDISDIRLDDVIVIREMASGKPEALSKFYDRWANEVYAIAISIVRVAQDAEEVVADVFWQAWNQASRFDASRGQVRQWITNIARSRALDRLKSVKRRREEDLDAAPLAHLTERNSAEDRLIDEERATLVARALKLLPAAQREVVEMTYYGGLSQTEIASCTGEPIGTVKTRVRLAMQKLRESMITSRQVLS